MTCVYCDHDLTDRRTRPAFDPWLGRLWRVCHACRRWNVVPLEDRWEALEAYERAARDRGRSLLRTEHLDLLDTGDGQLIRVGRAPRPELAGWRYGDVLPHPVARGPLAWLRRLVMAMPTSAFGYNAGHGAGLFESASSVHWFASPFIDHAPTLTAAFMHVPLAGACPACRSSLRIAPWRFQAIRLLSDANGPAVVVQCSTCEAEVSVPAAEARPSLRLGLSIVSRPLVQRPVVEGAARRLDRLEGPEGLLRRMATRELALGEIPASDLLALGMALDEQSEAELLEGEWKEAEEIAAIVDGALTEVEGLEELRRRVR